MDVGLKIERPYGPGIRVTWPKTQGGSRSIRMDEVPRGVRTAVAVAVSERSFAFFARPLQARPGLCYYTTLHSTKLMGVAVTLRLDSAYNRRAAAIEVGSGSRVVSDLRPMSGILRAASYFLRQVHHLRKKPHDLFPGQPVLRELSSAA